MSYEEIIANEIAELLEFINTEGWIEFDKTIELGNNAFVEVVGTVEYESQYEESTNYWYHTYIGIDIDTVGIARYDDDGMEIKNNINIEKERIAKYLKKILLK